MMYCPLHGPQTQNAAMSPRTLRVFDAAAATNRLLWCQKTVK